MLHKISNSAAEWLKLMRLKFKWHLRGGDMAEDYGWTKLRFSNDGDRQELWYHINCHKWHRDEVQALSPFLRHGDTVIDVGANIGFMTSIFAALVGPSGSVLAFEPSPRTYAKLKKHVEMNRLTNVRTFEQGCGETDSSGSLFTLDSSSGHASMVPPGGGTSAPAEAVRVVRLDDVVSGLTRRVALLKIDTEGYESAVLKGAGALLRRDRPTVYIELCSEYRKSSEEAIQILRDAGYRFPREPDLDSSQNGANFIAVHAASGHVPRSGAAMAGVTEPA